jgi:hypothetical protein
MNNDKTTIALEISTLNYQKLQYFALQQGLTPAAAIDRILSDHLQPQDRHQSENLAGEVEIEDEADEILWDFLEPEEIQPII